GLEPAPVDDVRRTLGAHDRDLGARPGEVDIGPELLRAHYAVGPAVGLAGDERDQGDGGLTIGVDELGSTADDAAVLLIGAGQEPGHVDEGEDRDVEGIAEADEPGRLL